MAGAFSRKFLMKFKKNIYRVLYNILYYMVNKDLVCFIEDQQSHKYMNISVLHDAICSKVRCLRISDGLCLKNIFHIARSKIIIQDKSTKLLSNLTLGKKTTCIQLWHSSGLYKKVGFDAMRSGMLKEKEYLRLKRIHHNIHYFIISDRKLVPYYAQAFSLDPEKILPFGLVRTDKYFSIDYAANLKAVHEAFPETRGKKILLYAPTYREVDSRCKRANVCLLDVQKLRGALGSEWCFAMRRHPSLISGSYAGWLDFSDLDQDLCLSCSDVLITDYSSILFDYAFFRRPIYLFVPDAGSYKDEQKDFYVTPEELAGESAVCRTTEDVIAGIGKNAASDQHIWERYMNDCDGHSCERVADFVLNRYNGSADQTDLSLILCAKKETHVKSYKDGHYVRDI